MKIVYANLTIHHHRHFVEALRGQDELVRITWELTHRDELRENLLELAKILKKAGYEGFYVNSTHPYSKMLQGYTHLVAYPRDEEFGARRLWGALRAAGIKYGCGNGLIDADQAQLYHGVALSYPNAHVLLNEQE